MTGFSVYTCDWPLGEGEGTCGARTRENPYSESNDWLIIQSVNEPGHGDVTEAPYFGTIAATLASSNRPGRHTDYTDT
jgi:hypothetical protein